MNKPESPDGRARLAELSYSRVWWLLTTAVAVALFAGGAIGGSLGALIAIPIAAVLRVLVRKVVAPAIRRQTGGSPS